MFKVIYNVHDQEIIDKMEIAINKYEIDLILSLAHRGYATGLTKGDIHGMYWNDRRRLLLRNMQVKFISSMSPTYIYHGIYF